MIRVGVLTYNVLSTLRDELLQQTLDSVERAFPGAVWHLLDNGSTDGSDHDLATPAWFYHRTPSYAVHSPGAGRNRLMTLMDPAPDDIVVLSDDDMLWRVGAGTALEWFWDDARDRATRGLTPFPILASGLMEPEFPWSRPTAVEEIGGLLAVDRPTVPAAAWTFLARHWKHIGPLKETVDDEGEDVAACRRLGANLARMVALDLAEHIGAGYSQLGNDKARQLVGRPFNPRTWRPAHDGEA